MSIVDRVLTNCATRALGGSQKIITLRAETQLQTGVRKMPLKAKKRPFNQSYEVHVEMLSRFPGATRDPDSPSRGKRQKFIQKSPLTVRMNTGVVVCQSVSRCDSGSGFTFT